MECAPQRSQALLSIEKMLSDSLGRIWCSNEGSRNERLVIADLERKHSSGGEVAQHALK